MALSGLSRSIAGCVAIITGAASGMGRATAHLFADEGARLALLDINGDGLAAVAAEVSAAGAEVMPLTVDLASRDAVTEAVAAVGADYGAIDILVKNAALVLAADLEAVHYS